MTPEEKSRALLIRYLSPRQLLQFAKTGTFTITNWCDCYTIKDYRIVRSNGSTQCFGWAENYRLPVYDWMLCAKLTLEERSLEFYGITMITMIFRITLVIALCLIVLGIASMAGALAYDNLFLSIQKGDGIVVAIDKCKDGQNLTIDIGNKSRTTCVIGGDYALREKVSVSYTLGRFSQNVAGVETISHTYSSYCLPIKVGSKIMETAAIKNWIPKGTIGRITKTIDVCGKSGDLKYVAVFDETPYSWCLSATEFEPIECQK